MVRRIRGKSLAMVAVGIVEVDPVVSEILGGAAVGVRQERAVRFRLRPPVNLGGNVVENSRKLKRRRNCWRSMIRSQQWKKEAKKKERAVELQEQAEVLAKVMKEQFD